jgi:SnoaL-like domain
MDRDRAADFVRRFEEYWRSPSSADLGTVLAERVRLEAPMTPTADTREQGARAFAELLELIPDLGVEVRRWGATDDGVMIEFTMGGTVGGRPLRWDAVDRFVVGEDGLATERVTYFDSAPIGLALASRPRAWPAFLRNRLQRRR